MYPSYTFAHLRGALMAFCLFGCSGGGEKVTTIKPPETPKTVWSSIAAGGSHICAIRAADSATYCWGNNSVGQLGIGVQASDFGQVEWFPKPVRVHTAVKLVRLAASDSHTCGLTPSGAPYCWGEGGNGVVAGNPARVLVPTLVSGMPALTSLTQHKTCGLTTTSTAVCWWLTVAPEAGYGSLRQITAGSSFICGVTTTGEGNCWGGNMNGQLGRFGDITSAPIQLGAPVRVVAAGLGYACALDTSGRATCWGRNIAGQLGHATVSEEEAPAPVNTAVRFDTLVAAAWTTCGLASGAAYCWGANTGGQLGIGTLFDQSSPAKVAGDLTFKELTVGTLFFDGTTKQMVCGLTTDGAAYCWGVDRMASLGVGNVPGASDPSRFPKRVVEPID